MKKIYFLLILFVLSFGATQAQDKFSLEDDSLEWEVTMIDRDFHKMKTFIVNSTSEELVVNWEITKIEGHDSMDFQLCDNNLCYDVKEGDLKQSASFTDKCPMEGGANSKGQTGTGKMEVKVYHESDETVFGTITYIWDFVVGIGQIERVKFELFPNPAQENLYINLDQKYVGQNIEIKIFNLLGQIQNDIQVVENREGVSLDVSNLRNGTYLVQLIPEDGEAVTQRFTKKG